MTKLKALVLTKLSGELYDQISEAVDKIRQKISEAFADGSISFREVLGLIGDMVREFVALVGTLGEMTPAEKKAAVLELVDEVYDKDIRPLNMDFVPDWIEENYVDPLIGQIVHTAADRILDMLIPDSPS